MSAVAERGLGIVAPLVRPFAEVRKGYTYFADGDVLFAKITPCMQNGKHAIARGLIGGIGFGSTEFHVIRPRSEVLPEWVLLYLVQPKVLQNATAHFSGAVGQQRVPEEYIASLEIPLPPLDDQRRTAAEIREKSDLIEEARTAAAAQLEAARALPAAYLRDLFESPEAQNWPLQPIGKVAKVQSGYAFKSEWFSATGIRLLRNANVHQGLIDWTDHVYLPEERRAEFRPYELSQGDIVLSLDRPLVAAGLKVARLSSADIPSLLLQRVGRFILTDEICDGFLYLFLNSRRFVRSITGHDQSLGVPHVAPHQVEAVLMPLPPMDRQRQVAVETNALLERGGALGVSTASVREALEAASAALLREAFDGRP
jgi:type I restriction enzyme S subunit